MKRSARIIFSSLLFLIFSVYVSGQGAYRFDELTRLPATPVKSQGKTGTCWVFATNSLLESELLRSGKGAYDLSEMFVVRQAYLEHARLFVRFQGHLNFGPGAQAWDVINVLEKDGLVPQSVLPGMIADEQKHNHSEMDAALEGYMESIIETNGETLSPVWANGLGGILSGYLGAFPASFEWKGQEYTPQSFREYLGLNSKNYIPLTSFKDHPYFDSYVFESPDNWSMESIYNLPLDGMIQVINDAIDKGYSVAWAADVSDPGFDHNNGLAVVPEQDWELMSKEEMEAVFDAPVEQRDITEEMRQQAFNNYSTTDDHLMHIIGTATDQKGTRYYIVKNSWGTKNPYDGYLYVSEAYVR